MLGNNVDKEQDLIVTLTLFKKSIEDLTERTNSHHLLLLGNGNPQDSIIWNLKKLSENMEANKALIQDVKKQLDEMGNNCVKHKELMEEAARQREDALKQNKDDRDDDNSTKPWSQVIKANFSKISGMVAIILTIILIYKPATDFILAIIGHFTKK